MGFIENALHPERKRQENWQRFSSEVGGSFVSEGRSGGEEVHIPFKGHGIQVRAQTIGRTRRTVLTLGHASDDFTFRIFSWGGREIPLKDRDPYLNSEFPDLAPRVKVEFNDIKKLKSLLANDELRRPMLEAEGSFTLEAESNSISLDNRTNGSKENGIITDVDQLHTALDILKCTSQAMEAIESTEPQEVLMAA